MTISKNNGWLEEARVIKAEMDKAPFGLEVHVGPTYTFCKKSCSRVKKADVCLDKCMGK